MSRPPNEGAFVGLYAQHQGQLFRYVAAIVPHLQDAEDVLGEVTVALWQNFPSFEPGTSFLAWARRIAYLAGDYLQERHALAPAEVLVEPRLKRLPGDVFHHHVMQVALDVKVVDLHDVRVMQLGHGLRLALEAVEKIRGLGQVRVEDLDRHQPLEPRLKGPVYFGHAAAPQARLELIFA